MATLDFSKLPIGTVVYDNTREGEGKIEDIEKYPCEYPIRVLFNNGKTLWYTLDGRISSNLPPTLSTENYQLPAMKCELPKPTFKVGDPVLSPHPNGGYELRFIAGIREFEAGSMTRILVKCSHRDTLSPYSEYLIEDLKPLPNYNYEA